MKTNFVHGNIEQFTAQLIPYAVQQVLSDHTLDSYAGIQDRLTVDTWLDPIIRGMVISLRAYIAGNDQKTTRTVTWPETWWDAFKLKYAPLWFRVWYPVKYHVETITTHVIYTCPHLSTATQPSRDHLEWLMYGPAKEDENEHKA